METHIQIKLFASLQQFTPQESDKYRIDPGISVQNLLVQLGIEEEAKLVFVDNVRVDLTRTLNGGECISIFPPVGGG